MFVFPHKHQPILYRFASMQLFIRVRLGCPRSAASNAAADHGHGPPNLGSHGKRANFHKERREAHKPARNKQHIAEFHRLPPVIASIARPLAAEPL
ncbi:hypothetical protein [Burkholderia ubonensis]|uniref:hypothetical protein n=1 Tax=Burkholderia ubonensis TaxID=101571 RepID=UPI0018DF9A2C|nr:hypothetical protein [Burkholderia ubonensis]